MTNDEAIKTIQLATSLVEWEFPMDYAAAFDVAVKDIKSM